MTEPLEESHSGAPEQQLPECPPAFVSSLRTEIVESQKTRTDLLKWKVILVAALSSAGLGINPRKEPLPIILAIIPLVCVYIDMVCAHNDHRIMMIGRYFRCGTPTESASGMHFRSYEELCTQMRPSFRLESFAISRATYFLSALLFIVAIDIHGLIPLGEVTVASAERWWIGGSALLAMALTLYGRRRDRRFERTCDDMPPTRPEHTKRP